MMGNLDNSVAHGQPFNLHKDSVASQKWFLKKKKKVVIQEDDRTLLQNSKNLLILKDSLTMGHIFICH